MVLSDWVLTKKQFDRLKLNIGFLSNSTILVENLLKYFSTLRSMNLHSALIQHLKPDSMAPGPLFTTRTGVLPLNPMKSRSTEIGCYNDRIALKFDRHLSNAAVVVPVKFVSCPENPSYDMNEPYFSRHKCPNDDAQSSQCSIPLIPFLWWIVDM